MALWQALQHALRSQHRTAVQDGGSLAYTGPQLLSLAAAAAGLLQDWSFGTSADAPPPPCAIYLTSSAAYVVAVLAALQLGLPFLPLDPGWPRHRLQQACEEARPAAVLWSPAAAPSGGGHGPPPLAGFPLVELPPLPDLLARRAVAAHPDGAMAGRAAAEQGKPAAEHQRLLQAAAPGTEAAQLKQRPYCYVLFTSGSTGRPLGVCGTEQGVLNRCRWMQQACPFQEGDLVAFKTSPCFVDSVWEVFGPLLSGVALVAVPQAVARDPAQLLRTLAEQQISHLVAVPSLWKALAASLGPRHHAASSRNNPSSSRSAMRALRLRVAVSSGEPLPPPLLEHLQMLLPPGCRMWNLYGTCEAAADCTAFDCTQHRPQAGQLAEKQVPVGQPISGTLLAVLDLASHERAAGAVGGGAASLVAGRRSVLPLGQRGEVAVAGAGLAAGYLCQRQEAAGAAQQERFVHLPTSQLQQAQLGGASVAAAADLPAAFWHEGTTRLFLTGDVGWLDASGCLQLAGRKDLQVKIAGVRIDLLEVEAALSQHPAVSAAAARLWQLPAGSVLAAYVELHADASGGSNGSSGSLQGWCRQRLPAAAVPRHLLVLPQLPRSAGGKVQRSQLPPPSQAAALTAAAEGTPGGAGEPAPPPSKRLRAAGPPEAEAEAAAEEDTTPPAASELQVSRAFAAALGHADFEATSSLFALGGNSLTAAQIAAEVAGGDIPAVFQHPSVRSLAAYLNSRAAAAVTSASTPSAAAHTAAPAAAAGVQLATRAPHVGSSGSSGPRGAGMLRLVWRARMRQCVDAAPLVSAATAAGMGAGASQQAKHGLHLQSSHHVFACSHGGDVCCYDASSGQRLWQELLPDRADAGLALCYASSSSSSSDGGSSEHQHQQQQQQYVAVATNSGALSFLHSVSGAVAGSVDTGGGIRAPPACDPWGGLVWQPTHGRQLLVAAAPGREVSRLPCPAAVSAAVSFAAERRLAFACCLDGSLLAVHAGSSSSSCGSLRLEVAWQRQLDAPLFVPATVHGSGVIAAAVDGSITALSCTDGSPLWRANVSGAVFAPPLLVQPREGRLPNVLLVGTQTGQVAALDARSGQQLAAVELGSKVTGLAHLQQQQQVIAVALAPGIVALLNLDRLLGNGGVTVGGGGCLLDAVQLPGDVFAPPGVGSGGGIAVGCRDDHLYFLSCS